MKKLIMIALSVVVVVALFGAHHRVLVQANESSNAPVNRPSGHAPAPVALAAHTLLTSYINQGDLAAAVSSGFQPVDTPVTINCTSAAGCTIGAEHWLQVGGQSTAGNLWAICTEVDGGIQFLCPYQGYIATDGTYVTGSFNLAVAVSPGTHTVQEIVFTAAGATVGDYHNTYVVYRP
jgi:hypothetical protein